MDRMLFCRITWMKWYQGELKKDQPSGGGEYVDLHGYGHEIYNYSDNDGNFYGFVEVPAGRNLSLERLSVDYLAETVSPVLIIWCARSPKDGRFYVVGWYKNATVFRKYQECPEHLIGKRNLPIRNDKWSHICRCTKDDAVLLPVENRNFEIPPEGSKSWGFGRSNVWYAGATRDSKFREQVKNYIAEYENLSVKKRKSPRVPHYQPDIEKRYQIEAAAIEAVESHYNRQGYITVDVSAQKKGWDIEAILNGSILKIEVKGLSGSDIGFELTPNEYQKMKALPKEKYRVCVLTEALGEKPVLHHFLYDDGVKMLVDICTEAQLGVQERTGAKIAPYMI